MPPATWRSSAWALRQWCRLAGTATAYIEPGSAWENPFVESFNGRVRDELLNVEDFATLLEAQVVTEAWRMECVQHLPTPLVARRPHARRVPSPMGARARKPRHP